MFGHFSHRSEWQLVKVDYKSIFDRRCAEEDYRPWQLHSQVGRGQLRLSPGWKAWVMLGESWPLKCRNRGFSRLHCPSTAFLHVLCSTAVSKLNIYSLWWSNFFFFFIVLGDNEIKFKCAWLRLTTQNEIPTQHADPNIIYLSMSYGCRVGAGVTKGSSVLSSKAEM